MNPPILIIPLLLVLTSLSNAQPASAFTYQGRLESDGVPANGSFDLRFTLHTTEIGGPLIDHICRENVLVTDGLFTTTIDFSPSVFSVTELWLEISVRADSIPGNCSSLGSYIFLRPRQPLTGAPHALSTRGIFVSDTNDVGLGTATPLARLHVNSTSANPDDNTAHFRATGIGPNVSHIHHGVFGDWYIRSAAISGKVVLQDTGGNVGIGTSTPSARLHISGGGTVLNAADRLFVTPSFVGVGRSSTVSVAEYFGILAPVSSGFGGMYVQTQGAAAQPFYGYATVPGTTAWTYLDGADSNKWKLDNGGVRMIVARDGGVGFGVDPSTDNAQLAVRASGGRTRAVKGIAQSGLFGFGVQGVSDFTGVHGVATAIDGIGVEGVGELWGVFASGDLGSSGSKSFNIDHPLDPENRYLRHYCHEGPEPQNVYNGVVTLDDSGQAEVELPAYFAAINKYPRYTLTALGAPMPLLHVAREIDDAALAAGAAIEPGQPAPVCTFRIAGGAPAGRVSWELKATRNDRWLQRRGAPVELDKPAHERGKYQHPELFGQPPERSARARRDGFGRR